MATAAASATAVALGFLSSSISSPPPPSHRLFSNLHRRFTTVRSEFNILFGSPSSNNRTPSFSNSSKFLSPAGGTGSGPVLIPWIVRGEDGKCCVQSSPPARFFHAMADAAVAADEEKKTKGPKKIAKKSATVSIAAKASAGTTPKYSKAARRYYNQNIREPQRLNKVLASAGVASRRSCEEFIFEGKVTVNGVVCTAPQTRVDLFKDSIYVNGNRLPKKLPPRLYFALNKPKGYICSCGDEPKSVISLFDEYFKGWNKLNQGLPNPRLFTVGRLDVATIGLLIVTNDGDFAQRLAHPSSNLTKEYIATVKGDIHKRHLLAISEGTEVEGVHCVPDSVELLPAQPDASRPRLRIVVHEGRNHEVRELVKHAGLELYSLKRVRIGGFRLPSDLGIGKHVELKPTDLKLLGG